MDCVCDPVYKDGHEYNHWIGHFMRDCVYSPAEIVSVVFGLLNIVLWGVANFPQMWENYKNKDADGITWGMLILWLLGDLAALVGCILTHQLPFQLYTSIWFVFLDILIIWQKAIYRRTNLKDALAEEESDDEVQPLTGSHENGYGTTLRTVLTGTLVSVSALAALTTSTVYSIDSMSAVPVDTIAVVPGRSLLQAVEPFHSHRGIGSGPSAPLCDAKVETSREVFITGCILAWASGMLYFGSRAPQILQNFKRKSVEGLSIGMFLLAISANTLYGMSIILRIPQVDAVFWESTLSYLVGSIGTLIFDITIFIQWILYRKNKTAK
eukprot:Clim_evm46s109 gene=Clim_evmTU46s109